MSKDCLLYELDAKSKCIFISMPLTHNLYSWSFRKDLAD